MRGIVLTTAAVAAAICLAVGTLWLSGCSKKLRPEPVSEISDTSSVTFGTLVDTPSVMFGTLTDARDGKTYKTVNMPDGNTWMAENLNYKTSKSWCYENNGSNCEKYGRLYDWETARTICPDGWHLPSDREWDILERSVGGGDKVIRGEDDDFGIHESPEKVLNAKTGWTVYDNGESSNGTDIYGFSALPGGARYPYSDGIKFYSVGFAGFWWSASENKDYYPLYYFLGYNPDPNPYNGSKRFGYSVRCVQNRNYAAKEPRGAEPTEQRAPKDTAHFTDSRDGRIYRAAKIGGKTWMTENLNYKTDSSWCYGVIDSNCGKYGRLYIWNEAQKICPSGWHLPSAREWDILAKAVGSERKRGNYGFIDAYWYGAGKTLKAISGWSDYEGGSGGGIGDYGFSALPGGSRDYRFGFINAGYHGAWWTATEDFITGAHYRYMGYNTNHVYERQSYFDNGFSVRCVLDESEAAGKQREADRAKQSVENNTVYFTDSRDNRKYRAVEIGGRRWMAENLNYKADSSWCYKNDSTYCGKHGRLYNWKTATTACPSGWHLPSREEWSKLWRAAEGVNVSDSEVNNAFINTRKKLKARKGWNDDADGKSTNGTDEFGFSALPSGNRHYGGGGFGHIGDYAFWWSATEYGPYRAYIRSIDYSDAYVDERDESNRYGFSVRCVQDGGEAEEKKFMEQMEAARKKKLEQQRMEVQRRIEENPAHFTDSRDGQKYLAAEIGGKRWMAQNLSYEPQTGNSWCYDKDVSNCDEYGRLYDWNTAKTICPPGWHLPSRKEWDGLGMAAGGKSEPNGKSSVDWIGAAKKLKAKSGWGRNDYGDERFNGTDDYGFSALPGGQRYDGGSFSGAGRHGRWWTTDAGDSSGRAYRRTIYNYSNDLREYSDYKKNGFSVRCVQDSR